MKFTHAVAIVSLFCSSLAVADDIRTIKLQKGDGTRFNKVLIGFSNPETIIDPNNSAIWHVVRKYESKNEALLMTCSTEIFAGTEGFTECSLTFNLSKSTPEVEVFEGKLAGALVAKFNESWEASKVNQNIGFMPYISMEKVSIKLPNGNLQPTPRVRIDCDKVPNSGGVAKSCTLVALPDQAN